MMPFNNNNARRLVYILSQSSSLIISNTSHFYTLDNLLHQRFFSGVCSLPPILNFDKNVKQSNGISFGALHGVAARSFHATGLMHMAGRDYYEVLGVSEESNSDQIKQAYYGLAKKFHPDVNKDDADADTKFQEIQKAHEILIDEEKRSIYDQVGHDAFEEGLTPLGDYVREIFEGGEDVKVSLELSFMEAIQGCFKTLPVQTNLPCEPCGGKGFPRGTKPETCKPCKGSGVVAEQKGLFNFTCTRCGGTGKAVKTYCKSCKGNRVVSGTKTVKIDVPPGIDDDATLKILRSGGADPVGNQPGDLYITVKVRKDPIFRREGADIHVKAVLSSTQATLGGTIQVPTLTGDFILKVPPGTQHGQKIQLKKKGIKKKSTTSFGDQYVHVNVITPTEENSENGKDAVAAAAAAYG
ncbi:Chaperone protein dnaj [Thalictrum thalictroides]|uniref:Chaperone protein dnaj n=1 Tax=Thalictrum thalictroides TaxID=46969 RepID=A0A7J6WQY9_THATH|nr:Chaperone protein dnaj [Thalictrum thalictroides]